MEVQEREEKRGGLGEEMKDVRETRRKKIKKMRGRRKKTKTIAGGRKQ